MNLNHVTVSAPDLDAAWRFYRALGLIPVVDSRPRYVRLRCPAGDATFSVHQGAAGAGTTVYFECDDVDARVAALQAAGVRFASPPQDRRWLWREAALHDPAGNRIVLYHAGGNRLDPPWRVREPLD